MSEFMVMVLKQHKEHSQFANSDDFVFCNPAGAVWNPDTMRDVIYRAMAARGIERIPRATRAHMFRHTVASFLLAQTGDLKMTSDQLVHADIKTTANIYSHADDARRLQSAEVLSASC